MSSSDDVNALFKRFGGRPEVYQEIVQEQLGGQASQRWPLLNAVHLDQPQQMPPVAQVSKPAPIFSQPAPAVPSMPSATVPTAPAVPAFSLSKPVSLGVSAPAVSQVSIPLEPKPAFSFAAPSAVAEVPQIGVFAPSPQIRPAATVQSSKAVEGGSELSRLFNRLEQGSAEQTAPGMNALFRRLVK